MDKSIVAVEESQRRSDSLASASKSFGSLVQINSIAIDISCAMEEIESTPHEHFSIRGYVAGVRKNDLEICLPFASEAAVDHVVDSLPPLSVPSFRWWQCSNCVPDIAAERNIVQMLLSDRGDAGPSSCQKDKHGLFSRSKQKIGDEHGLRDTRMEEDNYPSTKIVKYNPCCTGGHDKATTCNGEKTDMTNNVHRNPCADITANKSLQIRERHNDDAVDAPDMVYSAEDPSIRVDEPENASSVKETHRRKPKLRMLADIMEEEKNLTSEHHRTRSESTEMEADVDPHLALDVPTDIAKGTKSPTRKRKIGLVEDRVPLEITHPIGTAKRSKGPIPYAEKTCRRVENFEIESEVNASSRLNLQPTAKTKQIKPKKSKALDDGRKVRRAHIENRTVSPREPPKINAVHSENLHKIDFAAETSFNNNGPYFQSSIFGQKMDRVSDLSDHISLMSSRKNITGDCNVHQKVALDLTLNSCTMEAERNSDSQLSLQQHRGIPDLNVSFTEKTYVTQGKQLMNNIPENRSLNLHKNLDMSASCSKDMAREGKRQLRISEPQPFQNIMDNNVEHGGPSDDIPMEIVELLAKNQRERALGNSRKHLLPEPINNSIRGSSSLYMPNFPFTNTSVTSGNMGVRQRIPNFPDVVNCQFDMGNNNNNNYNNISSYRPSQQKQTQQLASNSVMSGPRPSEGADLLWPPRRKNAPLHLNGTKNHRYVQSNGLDMHAFSDHYYIGKPVSEINNGREKKVEEGRIGSRPKPVGSLDAYSNDAIPAMQLLSLMDRGVVPAGTSSDKVVASNGFPDKPFSPCNHHPRFVNENQKDPFFSSSFFSQSGRQTKDLPPLFNGVCFPSGSSKKPYLQGEMRPPQSEFRTVHLEGPSNPVNQQSIVNQQSRGNNNDDQELGVCTLNRNPADFSVPDAENEYTISGKDLKSRKRNYSRREKIRPASTEGEKRPRMKKDASAKECWRK
ncbi:hypothetical protein ABFS83_05G135100 [Erythranthe nasuta]